MPGNPKTKKNRPRLLDRIGFGLSTSRTVDGLWIGVFLEDQADRILDRVEAALWLIKTHDPIRYNRLIGDLDRVWVRILPEATASYRHSLRACQLNTGFVLAEDTDPEVIAATIVHEATHARLTSCGIAYEEALRPRVEQVCVRQELAFGAKLPDGKLVRERAERTLEWIGDPAYSEYWTNKAFDDQFVAANLTALRDFGFPNWLLKVVVSVRTLLLRLRRPPRDQGNATS
jgi:hypothetical protein